VPNSPEYIAQFMGAIWRMSLQTHYERDDAHSGAIVAAKWRGIWQEVQSNMGCCHGDPLINYYNYQNYQVQIRLLMQQLTLRYINASLDVQVAFFDVPDDYDADPGDAGDEIDNRNQALCLACESWVDEICNQGTSFIQGAVIDGIPFITGAAVVPFIPTLVVGFLAIGAAFFAVGVWSELNNEAYRDYLACAMYEALKGESTASQAGFDAAFDNLPARPPPPEDAIQDDARDIIELWLRGVVNDQENWLGFVSILGAAMSVSATLPAGSCSCISCNPLQFLMDASMDAELHFHGDPAVPAAIPMPGNGVGGVWGITYGETAGGIRSTPTGVTDTINYTVYIEVSPSCPVTWVQFRKRFDNSGANRGHSMTFYDAAGTLLHTAYNELQNVSSDWQTQHGGALNVPGCSWVRIHEETRLAWDDWCELDTIDITQ